MGRILVGGCVEIMRLAQDNAVDSVICDPPYELGFMGKKWDSSGIAYNVDVWKEAFRLLKPGGHLLAFGGSRTIASGQTGDSNPGGRFPANAIFDEEAAQVLDSQSGISKSTGGRNGGKLGARIYGQFKNEGIGSNAGGLGDEGGAPRFFYCPKAPKKERGQDNDHPTVKPIKLIEYLCKLITPPGGKVLDMFFGSGTLGVAANNLGFEWIGIELDKHYAEIASKRTGVEIEFPLL